MVEGLINTKLLEPADLDRISSTYLIDVDYSYPVPTVDRNGALATIQPYLREHGIYSRGRFGAWCYEIGNMDHSVMQGVELVNEWLLGEAEVTWKDFAGSAPLVLDSAFVGRASSGLIRAGEKPLNVPQVKRNLAVAAVDQAGNVA